jgi:UDP-glucose 4-epimerase
MRRVLVTGGTGYIGTRLVESLRVARDHVTILRRTNGALPDVDGWLEALEGIDAVVHLAAQTSAYVSDRDPIADAQANVVPVLALLEACARASTKTVVLAGTATVFGLPAHVPIADDASLNPVTIYDLHKHVAEQYLELYARMRGVGGATLRLCNVYGPGPAGTSADRGVINLMVRRAIQGQALTVYGTGELVRDYVYIDDVVAAFRLALDHAETLAGGGYLIGTGVGTRIVDAMQTIAQVARRFGAAPDVIHVPEPGDQSPIEKRNFIADASAFRSKTGWEPTVSFADGIARTFDAATTSE